MKLAEIGERTKPFQEGGTLAVITDENVAPHFLETCLRSLEDAGYRTESRIIPAGEESKSGAMYLELLNWLAEIPLTRSDGVVALGGGVVGDLAGFVAATFLRGVKVIQVPTTLLSAVDSSVGGKTAINLPAGKNLAGAFHQPVLVVQDPDLLRTLPRRAWMDGIGEVVKYGVLGDSELFDLLTDTNAIYRDPEPIITRCVEIKREIVRQDEFDLGLRHLLNFGHTIAHAVEILSDFRISHGIAVTKGMDRITEISVRQGWCGREVYDRLHALLLEYGFDLSIPYTNDQIYEIMLSDKKREAGYIDLVIPERIGRCVTRWLTMEELRQVL